MEIKHFLAGAGFMAALKPRLDGSWAIVQTPLIQGSVTTDGEGSRYVRLARKWLSIMQNIGKPGKTGSFATKCREYRIDGMCGSGRF